MNRIRKHLRNTFLAGIFSVIPLVVTVFVIWWIDDKTAPLTRAFFKREVPLLGIVLAVLAIYLTGLVTASLLGKVLIGYLDRVLNQIPGLRTIYATWKQVATTPGGKEGTFSRVVLLPVGDGRMLHMGFTSGDGLPGNPEMICVFVPGVPNPLNGRLYFTRRSDCRFLEITPEDGFKILLSTGNYVPEEVGKAAR